MTNAVSSSSLSSFSNSSTSSASSLNASSVSSPIVMADMAEKWEQNPNDQVGIIASFLPKKTMVKVLKNVKQFKGVLKAEYSKTLDVFKNKIGAQNYSIISATAISNLKRVIPKEAFPKAFEKISENKTLLTKRIFCNLFKKIKLMNGDGFLRSLFPNEDITSASKVMDYSIDPNVLEKMHQWVEDINLIIMMKRIAEQNLEVSQNLDQNLLAYIHSASIYSASIETVHVRAQSFRAWINDNNNVLLNVTRLNFDRLGLTSLPSEIDKFINLQGLYLARNYLTQLSDTLGNLVNLQVLYLSSNQLTQLPDSLGNLVNLRELGLSDNKLTQLPDSLGNLVNLRELYLGCNYLTKLSDTLGNLGHLQGLILHNNSLTRLPDTFGNLGNLECLDLYNNPLTQLPVPDMTNFLENVRKAILSNFSLKTRVSYYLTPYLPYLPKQETVIAAVTSVAFGYLTYTYNND